MCWLSFAIGGGIGLLVGGTIGVLAMAVVQINE